MARREHLSRRGRGRGREALLFPGGVPSQSPRGGLGRSPHAARRRSARHSHIPSAAGVNPEPRLVLVSRCRPRRMISTPRLGALHGSFAPHDPPNVSTFSCFFCCFPGRGAWLRGFWHRRCRRKSCWSRGFNSWRGTDQVILFYLRWRGKTGGKKRRSYAGGRGSSVVAGGILFLRGGTAWSRSSFVYRSSSSGYGRRSWRRTVARCCCWRGLWACRLPGAAGRRRLERPQGQAHGVLLANSSPLAVRRHHRENDVQACRRVCRTPLVSLRSLSAFPSASSANGEINSLGRRNLELVAVTRHVGETVVRLTDEFGHTNTRICKRAHGQGFDPRRDASEQRRTKKNVVE